MIVVASGLPALTTMSRSQLDQYRPELYDDLQSCRQVIESQHEQLLTLQNKSSEQQTKLLEQDRNAEVGKTALTLMTAKLAKNQGQLERNEQALAEMVAEKERFVREVAAKEQALQQRITQAEQKGKALAEMAAEKERYGQQQAAEAELKGEVLTAVAAEKERFVREVVANEQALQRHSGVFELQGKAITPELKGRALAEMAAERKILAREMTALKLLAAEQQEVVVELKEQALAEMAAEKERLVQEVAAMHQVLQQQAAEAELKEQTLQHQAAEAELKVKAVTAERERLVQEVAAKEQALQHFSGVITAMRTELGASAEGKKWLARKDAELEELRAKLGEADGEKRSLLRREAELEEQLSETALERLQEEMRMELQQQMRAEQNDNSLVLEKTMKEVDGGKFKFKFQVKSNISRSCSPARLPPVPANTAQTMVADPQELRAEAQDQAGRQQRMKWADESGLKLTDTRPIENCLDGQQQPASCTKVIEEGKATHGSELELEDIFEGIVIAGLEQPALCPLLENMNADIANENARRSKQNSPITNG